MVYIPRREKSLSLRKSANNNGLRQNIKTYENIEASAVGDNAIQFEETCNKNVGIREDIGDKNSGADNAPSIFGRLSRRTSLISKDSSKVIHDLRGLRHDSLPPAFRSLAQHIRRTSHFASGCSAYDVEKPNIDGAINSSSGHKRGFCSEWSYKFKDFPTRLVYRVAGSDTATIREILKLFPLQFKDNILESQYLEAQKQTSPLKSLVIGVISVVLVLLFWLGYGLTFEQQPESAFTDATRRGFHIGMGVALCGSVVFTTMDLYGRRTAHFSVITLLFLSLVCIGPAIWVLSTSQDLSGPPMRLAGFTQAQNLHHYIEIVSVVHHAGFLLLISIFVVTLFAINSLLTLRSISTVIAHIGLILLFTACEITTIVHAVRLAPEGLHQRGYLTFFETATVLEIVMFWITAGFSLCTRLHNELTERVEFFRWMLSLELLDEIRRHEKSSQDPADITPVEIITQFISKIRHLIGDSTGTVSFYEAQELLDQILHILRNSENLFSPTWQSVPFFQSTSYAYPIESLSAKQQIQQQFAEVYGAGVRAERRDSIVPDVGSSRSFEESSTKPTSTRRVEDRLSKLYSELRSSLGIDIHLNILKYPETIHPSLVQESGYILLEESIPALKTDSCTLRRFIARIEKLYQKNPYHNSVHGLNVAHAVVCIIRDIEFIHQSKVFSPLDVSITIISALAHDVGHPGRTNSFFVQRGDTMALVYNDISVLENFHCAVLFKTLQSNQYNIIKNHSYSEYCRIRQLVIKAIMATDMSHHFENVTRGRIRVTSPDFSPIENVEDVWTLVRLAMKVADLSHAIMPWNAHLIWSLRVAEEFFQQGDEERHLGLPLSTLCNRDDLPNLPKTQIGFLEYVVLPLVDLFTQLPCRHSMECVCLDAVKLNIKHWKQLLPNEEKQSTDPVVCQTGLQKIPSTSSISEGNIKLQPKRSLHNLQTIPRASSLVGRSPFFITPTSSIPGSRRPSTKSSYLQHTGNLTMSGGERKDQDRTSVVYDDIHNLPRYKSKIRHDIVITSQHGSDIPSVNNDIVATLPLLTQDLIQIPETVRSMKTYTRPLWDIFLQIMSSPTNCQYEATLPD